MTLIRTRSSMATPAWAATDALMTEGCGVLTEIGVQATMKVEPDSVDRSSPSKDADKEED